MGQDLLAQCAERGGGEEGGEESKEREVVLSTVRESTKHSRREEVLGLSREDMETIANCCCLML